MDSKYLALIRRFPLLPLETSEQHATAKEVLSKLVLRDETLSHAEVGYGKILVRLIKDFEQARLEA